MLHIRTITEVLLNRLVQKTDRYSLTQEDIQLISSASALHDIGKVSIPDEIINKPGKLTKEEFEIMSRTRRSARISCTTCRSRMRSRCSRPRMRSRAGITSATTAAAIRTA